MAAGGLVAGLSFLAAPVAGAAGGPTVTHISPVAGPTAGGNTVTITGSGFTGATSVQFGSAPVIFSCTVDTACTATAPSGSGTVDITVTVGLQSSATSGADQYTYDAPPTVTKVSPTAGAASGGSTVTVTGTNFVLGTTFAFGSAAATNVSCSSATTCTAKAPAGTGAVDVVATTPGGTSATSAADRFVYGPPTVTALSPTGGATAGGNTVTITGTGFTPDSVVKFGPATVAAGNTSCSTTTTCTAKAPAGTGTVDVTVITPAGTSATGRTDQYTYGGAAVTGLSPAAGPAAGGTTVTVSGSGFTPDSTVRFGSAAATGVSCLTSTTCTATAPSGTGDVDVSVTTPTGTSATASADVFSYAPVPSVTAVAPNAGPPAGGNTVTVTGTGLSGARFGSTLTFGSTAGTGVICSSATSCNVQVPAGSGSVHVTATTPGGTSPTSSADLYTFGGPAVTGVSPTAGAVAGGNPVTITGLDFVAGSTTISFGANPATGVSCSSTSCSALAPAGTGTVDVVVTTPAGASSPAPADRYTYGAPTVASISPQAGPAAGGTTVTLSGTGFTTDSTVRFAGTLATSASCTPTSCTATAPSGSGDADVTVTNPQGSSATSASDVYSYAGVPTVSAISPTAGAAAGGNTVAVTGTNLSGTHYTAGFDFGPAPATGVTCASASSCTVTPPPVPAKCMSSPTRRGAPAPAPPRTPTCSERPP